jgi:hypothetical protein
VFVLTDGTNWSATGRTDENGRVRFQLRDLPEHALLGVAEDSSALDNRIHLTVRIGRDASIRLVVSKEMTAKLSTALNSDARSRASFDRAARESKVEQVVALNRTTQVDEKPVASKVEETSSPTDEGRKHLALPGWEDLVVGDAPPADVAKRCRTQNSVTLCEGCRSTKLPTPCVEIMLGNPDPNRVSMVTTVLPNGESAASATIARLRRTWGEPTYSQREKAFTTECWDGAFESISLTIAGGQQPRRVVAITDTKCSP